jgi:hypothetical protein
MAEEIIFNTKVNTGSSKKSVDDLDKSLKGVGKEVDGLGKKVSSPFEELKAKVEAGGMSMREMNKAIKDFQSIALQAGRTSPIGQEALQQAARMKDTVTDLRNETSRLANDHKNLQGAMELGGGIVAGYGAVKSSMALLGVENENLAKSMQKIMAVQTLLNSVNQIKIMLEKESSAMLLLNTVRTKAMTVATVVYTTAVGTTTGAMKLLRIAMLALPIMLIIAGIAALVAALAGFFSEAEKAEEMNNKLNDSFNRQNKAIEANERAYKRNSDNKRALMVAEGATAEELHEFDMKRMKDEELARQKNVKFLASQIDKKREAYKQALKEENFELAKTIREEIEAHRDKYKSLKELDGQYAADKKLAEINRNNEKKEEDEKDAKAQADRNKKYAEERRKKDEEAAKKKLELEKTLADLTIANIQDENQRAIAELALKQEREREDLRQKYGENATLEAELKQKQTSDMLALMDAQDKAYEEQQESANIKAEEQRKAAIELANRDKKAELETKLINITEDFYAEQELKAELALIEMETLLENDQLTANERLKIEAEYNEKIRELKEQTTEYDKQLTTDAINNGIEWAEKSLNALTDLSDAYFANKLSKVEKGSKAEETIMRKQFKMNKAMQLGGAIIDAGKAVMSSLAQSPIAIGPVPNPAGIASLALVAASSAASIAKIMSAKFEGGGGAARVEPPSIPSMGSVPMPPIDGTATAGLPGSGQQQTTKVAIVDSDLKIGLEKLEKSTVTSSFG